VELDPVHAVVLWPAVALVAGVSVNPWFVRRSVFAAVANILVALLGAVASGLVTVGA
jgi:hypothetical protein